MTYKTLYKVLREVFGYTLQWYNFSIPQLKHSGTRLKVNDETEVEFQRLASAISLQSLKNRRLLIASAIVGEGKTAVTPGLATALVDLGFRVLVVDGDFRQAELSHRLRYTQDPGAVGQPVQIQSGLDLLPTLPKRGKIVELVTQGRFEQALAAAQSAMTMTTFWLTAIQSA